MGMKSMGNIYLNRLFNRRAWEPRALLSAISIEPKHFHSIDGRNCKENIFWSFAAGTST